LAEGKLLSQLSVKKHHPSNYACPPLGTALSPLDAVLDPEKRREKREAFKTVTS
jgi:hypothetical protein